MAKRLCLVDDLKLLKITMSNTSSRNKLNPEVNDHYNIFSRESQECELKTKDEALYASINITTVEPVTTASAPITTAGVSVSTAEPSTPPTKTTTTLVEDEDLTIAQTLIKMKSEKSKVKGVTMEDICESGTRVRVPPPQIDLKDKGKEKMVEPEKPKNKKDQIEYDVDVAQSFK
ncbi:hypothetical protein Tco_0740998 [Tanacetum coccineum]